MVKILSIVFLLTTINFSAQNTLNGKVLYKYRVNEEKISGVENQAVLNRFKNSLTKSSEKIRYELIFNNKESSYKLEKKIIQENDNFLNYAILITGGTEEFYLNKENKKKLKKIEFLGERFIINGTMNEEWILTQETKTIGDYICYKATLNQTNKQKNTKIKLPNIDAWYCPEIPLVFGPKGYGNLPGLILELNIGPISYYAAKIKLNPVEKIEIKKPKAGKLISEEEFNDLLIKINTQHTK